jgi:hypothetical protein
LTRDYLLKTLPAEIRGKVQRAIERGNGILKKGSLDNIRTNDENFAALKFMVDSATISEGATSDRGDGIPFYRLTNGEQYERDITDYMKNFGASRAEAEKIISKPADMSEVQYYAGQTYSPDGDPENLVPKSPSGYIRGVANNRTGDAASISEEDAVVTFAHEFFGHVYQFVKNNPIWGGHGPVIKQVEDRTRNNYRNGEKKKDDPANLKPKV